MKVLVADKFEQSGLDGLRALGCEVIYDPSLKEESLIEALRLHNPDILVVRSTKVTAPMLEAGDLSLVIRAGAGVNTIDVATASKRGIYVANCPGKNAIAVAELAFGLILSLDRRIPDNVQQLREGRWNKKEFSEARGLAGQTLGLIGVGNIGREMIPRARAFGMRVIAWSRSLTPETAEALQIGYRATPLDVASEADIVSVHVALTPETHHLCGRAFFEAMKPGAYFINTARAEVVDEEALLWAVREKGIRAGLDVFSTEPAAAEGAFDNPLVHLPNVYGTHHIGASTQQAQEAIAEEVVNIVRTYMQTGHVPNVVNLAKRTPARYLLVVRHLDRVGVLAHVFDCLREAQINVQETENIIFEGAEAAVARIQLDSEPSAEVLRAIRSNSNIFSAVVMPL
ncbi:D-3-phosphoglycerate dehydrogenase [Armatimonadetes bacterium GBS]|jgi:D-3-phosphoglycerate dehydrogenase|nr:D-3-phosphoglycerate dehydrogenase [Armatimonadetes bacterium GBS]CUU34219.1 D-3-phosphoglycerate dehydrogenase [Armatimonadetes bacterium GXS]